MDELDKLLGAISQEAGPGLAVNFTDGLWSRIGQIQERRTARRNNMLAAAMFVVAVGTGFGVTEKPAMASSLQQSLMGSTDYTPSALLHVTP